MHIAIRRYRTEPKLVEPALKAIVEDFMPVLRMTPGFVAYYAYREGADRLATLSLFQDQASAEASSQSAAKMVKMSLSKLLPNPPEVFLTPVAGACHGPASAAG